MKAKVKEFFTSIQGEGTHIGTKQLFIRFCTCNLNCKYCDTDFLSNESTIEYSAQELFNAVRKLDLTNLHSVSLTGGEPLLEADFLTEFLPLLKNSGLNVYLETNATLAQQYEKIAQFVDIISADIKLESATGISNLWEKHDKFFAKCTDKDIFAKIVFDQNITEEEIIKSVELAKTHNIELILSPMMIGNNISVNSTFIIQIFDKFLKLYPKVRVIPQVHKFLCVE